MFAAGARRQFGAPRVAVVDPTGAGDMFAAAFLIFYQRMLSFLYVASKKGVDVASYHDRAVGYMEASAGGKLSVTRVVLKPEIAYRGEAPSKAVIDGLHHAAHEECFIANSVKTDIRVESA